MCKTSYLYIITKPMKNLYLLLFILFSNLSYGQQYDCFLPNAKQFFTNDAGYLRGIRIDSVSAAGTDTIYYPFHSVRGNYSSQQQDLDSNGGSWLGKKVIRQADGTYLFDDIWGDTIVIKTQAAVGDNWVLFRDSSSVHFVATITAVADTTIAAGVQDSVKTIVISAYDDNNMPISSSFNGYTILLSKAHGFVQIFDIYTFPYQNNGYWPDYYLSIAGTGYFRLIDLYNSNFTELYNFSVGDQYEHNAIIDANNNQTYIDTVVNKTVNSNSISYTTHRLTKNEISGGPNVIVSYSVDTTVRTVYYNYVIDTAKMPEEWNVHHIYYYFPNSTLLCDTGYEYIVSDDFILNTSGSVSINTFEPCGLTTKYKTGLGDIENDICIDPIANNITDNLVYSFKNNQPCGNYINLEVATVLNGRSISLYPNPVSNELQIQFSDTRQRYISLCNILGQTISSFQSDNKHIAIDVSTFTSGIYTVMIKDENGLSQNSKIMVLR
jgi:Secretion system C-terminal sorting domain